ncbi:lymphocyte antigen 6L isoform X2 [Ailuropoda melanoleuca]|uniref:lymphocyte antigen 6L isoform X2 n=1 Tax=Ailuropoda melanoleuca TaxID=9646 RepID=UPI00059B3310|nr:lymphocyte antigen 6L isoform X2 [Ailuropoda melanoleuca]
MEGLVPVLCALLVSAEFAGSKKEPGVNLSCYQCFKAASHALCTPTVCDPSDRVCVSNAVVFLRKSKVILSLSKRCAPRCPNTNMNYEWTLGPRILGRISRRCCSGNLCNRAPTIQQDPWALRRGFLLAAGLLWVLL